jgi:hypothetical protein
MCSPRSSGSTGPTTAGHPVNAFRQPPPDQKPALLVLDLDFMMGLGPVITNEQQHVTPVMLTPSPTDGRTV